MKKRGFHTLVIVLVSWVITFSARAAEIHAEVEPTQGTAADSYFYSLSINETSGYRPDLEPSDDWQTSYVGPRSQLSIINGSITRSETHIFQLKPKKTGKLYTPKATVEVGGETLTALPIEVIVSDAPPEPDVKEDVSLSQAVSREWAYKGEQIVNRIELRTRVNLVEPRLAPVSPEGFWEENLGQEDNGSKIINGRPNQIVTLRRALFPLRTGKLKIPPREVQAKVPQKSKSHVNPFGLRDPFNSGIFDDVFGHVTYKDVTLRAQEISLEVRDLPPLPPDYIDWGGRSPLVGETELLLTGDNKALKVGESRTFTLQITSLGNLNPLRKLPVESTSDYKIYEEPPKIESFENNGELVSRKKFAFSVVPLHRGTISIPPIAITFFNPADGVYKKAQSESIQLHVEGAPAVMTATPVSTPIVSQLQTKTVKKVVTTLPPAPASPYYEEGEPRFLEKFKSLVSPSLLTLGVVCTLLLGILVWIFFTLMERRKKLSQKFSSIQSATSLSEFRSAFIRAVGLTLKRTVSAELSLNELRSLISSSALGSDQKFYLLTITTDLEETLYSSVAEGRAGLDELRSRSLEALKDG